VILKHSTAKERLFETEEGIYSSDWNVTTATSAATTPTGTTTTTTTTTTTAAAAAFEEKYGHGSTRCPKFAT
jgi:hypothetical protein